MPSHFGLEHFVSSGVQRNKIAVVPEAAGTSAEIGGRGVQPEVLGGDV